MKLTYYGHSCFSVEIYGKHILFDPFIRGNPLAKCIDIDRIPADYIFISHAHFDHVDDLLDIGARTKALVVANIEIAGWCNRHGLSNTQALNPGGQWKFDFGVVRCVSAVHSSSFINGENGGIACGFVFTTLESNFYYSGDTALTLDMQLIPNWTTLDFAVLPVGDHVTMGYEDAADVAQIVKVTRVFAVHYDTFPFIAIDHAEAAAAFQRKGIVLHLTDIGSVTDL